MDFNFDEQIKSKRDEELIDIYINSASYQPEFVEAAMSEIEVRKLPLESIQLIKTEKEKVSVATLAVGKQGSPLYIAICFAIAIFGGIFSIVAGYIYAYSKQKGSDGNMYYVYNESTRKIGTAIMATGALVVFMGIWMKLTH